MLRQIAHVLAALALPVALAASPAAAQPIPGLVLATCETSVDAAQEAADQALVEQIIGELNNGGFAALARRAPALREIMGRAPACYPRIERRSDQIIVHTSDAGEFMVLSAVLGGDAAQGGQGLPIVMRQNTYPLAAFLLGSDANEARRPEEALAWLDRGLAMQPEDSLLILERVASLNMLRRFEDAHAMLDAALNNPALALTLDRPRFLRNKGIALIDLERLDEAEATLNESIRLQPNNPVARSELQYIAELRGGAARRELQITAPNAPGAARK